MLELLVLVSSAGKGFVTVVASSHDSGGDSGSGAMCSVLHTRVSHLPFIGFGFLQVVRIVPGDFGCVFMVVANMVLVDFDGGVTVTKQVGLCCSIASVYREPRQKSEFMASILEKPPLFASLQYATILEPK